MCDHRVWLVKSHWPERRGASAFAAHAAILIVRSPFDCIDSYFNMVLTASHNASVPDGDYERLRPGRAAPAQRRHLLAPQGGRARMAGGAAARGCGAGR